MENYIMEKVRKNKDIFDEDEWYMLQQYTKLVSKIYQVYMLEDLNTILEIRQNPV